LWPTLRRSPEVRASCRSGVPGAPGLSQISLRPQASARSSEITDNSTGWGAPSFVVFERWVLAFIRAGRPSLVRLARNTGDRILPAQPNPSPFSSRYGLYFYGNRSFTKPYLCGKLRTEVLSHSVLYGRGVNSAHGKAKKGQRIAGRGNTGRNPTGCRD
jgi:hypothetical protein